MQGFDTRNPLTWVFVGIGVIQLFRMSRLQWMFDGVTKHEIPPALVVLLAGGGLAAMAGESPGNPMLWLSAALGLWVLQYAAAQIPGPPLTAGEHFRSERTTHPGRTRILYLLQMEAYQTGIVLRYQCPDQLSAEEADHVDNRIRAYVACCLGDAARRGGLHVSHGPPHGRRPSWVIEGFSVPIGLQQASFERERKVWVFNLNVGPIMLGGDSLSEEASRSIYNGFIRKYRILRV